MVKPEDIMEYCPECQCQNIVYAVYEADCVFWKCSGCHNIVDIDQADNDWPENYPDF